MITGNRPKKTQLSDAENAAVKAELERLKAKHKYWRKVGVLLKFPEKSAQATISAAVKKRAGREVADALYAYLGTTRETFLRSCGVEVEPVRTMANDQVSTVLARIGEALGFNSAEVALAISMVRDLDGIEITDEGARELLECARSNRRDVRRMLTTVVAKPNPRDDALTQMLDLSHHKKPPKKRPVAPRASLTTRRAKTERE